MTIETFNVNGSNSVSIYIKDLRKSLVVTNYRLGLSTVEVTSFYKGFKRLNAFFVSLHSHCFHTLLELEPFFCQQVMTSNLFFLFQASCFIGVKTVPILKYFNNRSTNASAESFNAKIKAQFRGVRDVKFYLYRWTKLFA